MQMSAVSSELLLCCGRRGTLQLPRSSYATISAPYLTTTTNNNNILLPAVIVVTATTCR